MWQDLIDVNAGPIATGEATIQEIGTQLFNKIIAVASGKDQSFAEKYKLHNDLSCLHVYAVEIVNIKRPAFFLP